MRKNLLSATYTIMFMIFSLLIPHSYSLKATFENLIDSEDSIALKIEFDTIQEMVKYLDEKTIEINFDDEKFAYNKLDYTGSLRKASIIADREPNKLNISLRTNKDYKKLKYKTDVPEKIEAKFKIINKNISVCETPITVNSVDLNKKTVKSIYETSLKIGSPEIDKCKLKNLIPDIGTLNPSFNPKIYEYDMVVDCDIKSLDFEAIPMLEHLDVKIAHRNLSAPGKYTDVTITVSNPDLKLKETYTVHVYREEKVKEIKEKSSKSKNKSSDNKIKKSSTIQAISKNEIQNPKPIINTENSKKISKKRSKAIDEDTDITSDKKENINQIAKSKKNPVKKEKNSYHLKNTNAIEREENIDQIEERKNEIIKPEENIDQIEECKNETVKPEKNTQDEEKTNYSLTKIDSNNEVSESKNDAFNLYIIIIIVILLLFLIIFWIFKNLNNKKSSLKHSTKEISRNEDEQQ